MKLIECISRILCSLSAISALRWGQGKIIKHRTGETISKKECNSIRCSMVLNAKITKSLISARGSNQFMRAFRQVTKNATSLNIDEKQEIIDELDFRINSLEFQSLSECLLLLGRLKMNNSNSKVATIIDDILNSLVAMTYGGKHGSSADSIAMLLKGLVFTSSAHVRKDDKKSGLSFKNKWSELPTEQQQILLMQISTIVLTSGSISPISDSLWSLGKLGMVYSSHSDNLFRNSLLDFLESHENMGRSTSKVLYSLSLIDMNWFSDLSQLARFNIMENILKSGNDMFEIEIVNMIYAFAKMGAKWSQSFVSDTDEVYFKMDQRNDTLSTDLTNLLLQQITRVLPEMNGAALANVFWSLGRLEVKWELLPGRFRQNLIARLIQLSDDGKKLIIKTRESYKGKRTKTKQTSFGLNPQSLSNFLLGFQSMGAKWSDLNQPAQQSLYLFFPKKQIQNEQKPTKENNFKARSGYISNGEWYSEQTLANIIWVLGSLDVNFESFDPESIVGLLDSLQWICPELTVQGYSNSLYGLAKMGFQYDELPKELVKTLEFNLPILWKRVKLLDSIYPSPPLDPPGGSFRDISSRGQTVSTIIWSLGQLQALWKEMDKKQDNYFITTQGWIHHDKEKKAFSLVSGGKGFKDNIEGDSDNNIDLVREKVVLSREFREVLAEGICVTATEMTDQGLSNTLLGLAKMGATWDLLSEKKKSKLISALCLREKKEMNEVAFVNSLWALGIMGKDWCLKQSNDNEDKKVYNSTVRIHQMVLSVISNKNTNLSGRSLATIYYSLARLSHRYMDLEVALKALLEQACCSLYEQGNNPLECLETANILYSLGKMSCKFSSLPVKMRLLLLDNVQKSCLLMTEQELGNTVWGLVGGMGLNINEAPKNLVQAISSKQSRLRKQALLAILQGIGRNDETTWEDLPKPLKTSLIAVIHRFFQKNTTHQDQKPNSNPSIINDSRLAGLVLLGLGKLQVEWTNDELSFILHHKLLNSLPKSDNFSPDGRAASTGLNGIARMRGTSWHKLSPDVKTQLLLILDFNVDSMVTSDFAGCLWSLSRLGLTVNDLPEVTKEKVFDVLAKNLGNMNTYELTWSLWSLGRLNWVFTSGKYQLQDIIIKACCDKIQIMNREELGLLLWSFGKIEIPFNELPENLQQTLFSGIEAVATSESN